ncbi:hypothetical protein Ancab_031552 [Ancistrocladus abbreviatus]
MFNNAGISRSINVSTLGTNDEELNRVFNVNVYGSFLGAKHAAKVMTLAKSGVILFTSSIATLNTSTTGYAYTMSEHAVNGLMKNLCIELGQYGIRVNAISPGAITTPLMPQATGVEKSVIDGLICESGVLKGVVPEVEDVAKVALYLASNDANNHAAAPLFHIANCSNAIASYVSTFPRPHGVSQTLVMLPNPPISGPFRQSDTLQPV